jgi:hypothetical protein
MPLPWVRLDSNVASHDKILGLKHDPSPKKWQAMASYFCALAWSGGQGTDGYIPAYALETIHGTAATARLLVKHRLWEEAVAGYKIRNYEARQELEVVSAGKREAKRVAAEKGNCSRWHGADCWQAGRGCSRDVS